MAARPSFDRIVRVLHIPVSLATRRACRYLERHGYQFCADFGTLNCRDIARQVRKARKQHKRWRR